VWTIAPAAASTHRRIVSDEYKKSIHRPIVSQRFCCYMVAFSGNTDRQTTVGRRRLRQRNRMQGRPGFVPASIFEVTDLVAAIDAGSHSA